MDALPEGGVDSCTLLILTVMYDEEKQAKHISDHEMIVSRHQWVYIEDIFLPRSLEFKIT